MLGLPARDIVLEAPLEITRSQTVLRGVGEGSTTLLLPNSLTDVQGGSAPAPPPAPRRRLLRGGGRRAGGACTWGAAAPMHGPRPQLLIPPIEHSRFAGPDPDTSDGYYVFRGAFLTARGAPAEREEVPGGRLLLLPAGNGSLPRGSRVLEVRRRCPMPRFPRVAARCEARRGALPPLRGCSSAAAALPTAASPPIPASGGGRVRL